MFGAGALAGTVELDSAGPDDLAGLGGRISYGSRQSVDAVLTGSIQASGGFASLSAAYARSDGFAPIIAAQRGPADRPAPYEQASLAGRAVVPAGAQTELQANVLAFTDRRKRGTAFTRNGSDAADSSVRLIGRGA